MKNKSKRLLLAVLLAGSVALLATGCDKLKKEPETEKVTEPPTEKPTEPPTEKPTEPPTEPPTEAPTEPPTESETEPKVLTVEEEKAQETQFENYITVYAADDINVRTAPGTGDDSEIFDSFDQGEAITVVGETPGWYIVDLEDYEQNGYVSKEFVSGDVVEPKSEEERAAIAAGETVPSDGEDTSSDDGNSSSTPVSTGTNTVPASDIDQQYSIETYDQTFAIEATAGANIREAPSQDGDIIGVIASGTSVTALGGTDRWYKIDYNGMIGYVNRNLFSE